MHCLEGIQHIGDKLELLLEPLFGAALFGLAEALFEAAGYSSASWMAMTYGGDAR